MLPVVTDLHTLAAPSPWVRTPEEHRSRAAAAAPDQGDVVRDIPLAGA